MAKWVTIKNGKFKCKFTANMLFSLRMVTGDYLHSNPNDEEVKALYAVLPTREELTGTRTWTYGSSTHTYTGLYNNPTLMLDPIHLCAIKKMLPLILVGGWTQGRAVKARLESFDKIPVLQQLAMAAFGMEEEE